MQSMHGQDVEPDAAREQRRREAVAESWAEKATTGTRRRRGAHRGQAASAEADVLNEQLTQLSRQIGQAKREGRDAAPLIEQHRSLRGRLGELEREEKGPLAAGKGGAADSLSTSVISSPGKLEELRPAYDGLLERSTCVSPYLSLEWLLPWFRAFGNGHELRFIAVHEGTGALLGGAPLMVGHEGRHRVGRRVVRFLGTGGGVRSSLLSFVCDRRRNDEVLSLLVDRAWDMAADGAVVQLDCVSPFEDGRSLIRAMLKDPKGDILLEPDEACVFGPLPTSYEQFIAKVPRRTRRRYLRRGDRDIRAACGHAEYEDCLTRAQVEPFLETLAKLNMDRQARKGLVSTFAGARARSFRARAMEEFLARGWLRLERLRIGEDSAAALAGFVYKGTYFAYQLGFDERFSKQRVMHTLISRRIRECISEGLEAFNFGPGNLRYKREYFSEALPELKVRLLPQGGFERVRETGELFLRSLRRWALGRH